MKRPAVLIAMLSISGICAMSSFPPDGDGRDEREKIAKLIKALEDDDIQVREEATKKLIEIATDASNPEAKIALEELRKAARSSDAEVKHRVDVILTTAEVRERMSFSAKLTAWYPSIYEEIGRNNSSIGIYCIFRKIIEHDWDRASNRLIIDPIDVANLVKLMCQDNYMGLTEEEKKDIVNIITQGQGGIALQTLPYLIPFLTENSDTLRGMAATAISFDHSDKISTPILQLLRNENPRVRISAIQALGTGLPEHPQEIESLLSDESENVRIATIQTLSSLGEPRYGKRISSMLNDKSPNVRHVAIGYFRDTQPALNAIDAIFPLLKDTESYVRSEAIESLGMLGARHAAPDIATFLKDEDSGVRSSAVGALEALKAREFTSEITLLLADNDIETRIAAVHALGELRASESVKKILPLIKDDDAIYETLLALIKIRAKGITREIAPLLKSPDPTIRSISLSLITDTGRPEDCKDILPLLNDSSKPIYVKAFTSVGKLLGKKAEKDIIPYLKDQERRMIAVETLARIGATGAAKEVVPMLLNEDFDTRGFALHALGILKAREYAKDVAHFLDDEGSWLQKIAIEALGNMGAGEYGDKLVSLLEKGGEGESVDNELTCMILTALGKAGNRSHIDSIAKYLSDTYQGVQFAAALTLGKLGGREYAPTLIPLLFNNDYDISAAALEALCRLKAIETIDEIRLRTKGGTFTPYSILAIGALGTKDDKNLLLPLLNDNEEIRPFAAIALVELGCGDAIPSETIPELMESLKDILREEVTTAPSEIMRPRIENALRQLGMTQEDIEIYKELAELENEGDC